MKIQEVLIIMYKHVPTDKFAHIFHELAVHKKGGQKR